MIATATRTDWILLAVREELNRRRPDIDRDCALTTLSIVVELRPDGSPHTVLCRTESRRRLTGDTVR